MKDTLILIEDDPQLLDSLVGPFAEAMNLELLTFMNASDALLNLDRLHSAKAIILDLIIPEGQDKNNYADYLMYPGLGLLRKLKEELGLTTPVVVLSIVSAPEVRNALRDLGIKASRVVSKPAPVKEFERAVLEAINEPVT